MEKTLSHADVLVVEDDPEIRELLGAYVRLAGFHFIGVGNGKEALAACRQLLPAAIILDIMLPDMDGFDICRKITQDTETGNIPIIILTALDSLEDRRRGLESGATVYLNKPFDPDELLTHLRELMHSHIRP